MAHRPLAQADGATWRPIFDAIPDVQLVTLHGLTSGTFNLTFTGPNSAGTVAGDSTPLITYDPTNLFHLNQNIRPAT